MKVKSESEVAQSCQTLSDPMDCSLPGSSVHGILQARVGDLGSIPGLGRSPGEGKGYPLQSSDLENSIYCIVHGVEKSQFIEHGMNPIYIIPVIKELTKGSKVLPYHPETHS